MLCLSCAFLVSYSMALLLVVQFDVPSQKVDQIHPSKPLKPPLKEKPAMPAVKRIPSLESSHTIDDVPGTSA